MTTDRDRQTARAVVAQWAAGSGRPRLEELLAEALAAERARALAPFRDLEAGYPLGTNVPVYRISRAIDHIRPCVCVDGEGIGHCGECGCCP